MQNNAFQVKPVASYDKPRYFAAPVREQEELLEERHSPLTYAVLVVLVLGISIGLIGCYLRSDYQPDPILPDGGPDGDPPDPPACDEGALRCVDTWTLSACQDEEWVEESCDDVCAETFGADYWATGCDAANAANPCGCQYDIIDGDVDPCYPNDVYCVDEQTLFQCSGDWQEQSCTDYCHENFGYEYSSGGCDASAEDPCQCFYDMIEGVMVECTPDELYCVDNQTLETCQDGMYVNQSCNDLCVATHGPDWYSQGCNTDAEDPCQCAYGLVDGEMVECELGDVTCLDDATLGECIDSWYQPTTCQDRCVELFGEGALSDGCDATNADDPCRCIVAGSGGDSK